MEQVIEAYRRVSASDEFKEIERLRSRARHDEASALRHAEYKKAIKIAKNFKAKGFSINDIADATGLTVDDVLRL